MKQAKSGKGLHRLFELAILIKGVDGVLETVGGLLILFCALWREKLWAFPVALWFIALFVVYEIYRFTHTHSIALLIFALLDVCVAWFIWREYLTCKGGPRPAK